MRVSVTRLKALFVGAMTGVLLGFLLRFLGFPTVEASHPYPPPLLPPHESDPHDHLLYIARPDVKALWCVEAEQGTGIGESLAASQVSAVLYGLGYSEISWHDGVSNLRFKFVASGKSCSQTITPHIRFRIEEEPCITDDEGGQYSCMNWQAGLNIYNPYTKHHERRGAWVKIWVDHWTSDKVFFINHELGHAFGLQDGGPELPFGGDPGDPPCPTDPPSVMHIYGCPAPDWPTSSDFDSVRDNSVEVGSGSSGNFGFNKGL